MENIYKAVDDEGTGARQTGQRLDNLRQWRTQWADCLTSKTSYLVDRQMPFPYTDEEWYILNRRNDWIMENRKQENRALAWEESSKEVPAFEAEFKLKQERDRKVRKDLRDWETKWKKDNPKESVPFSDERNKERELNKEFDRKHKTNLTKIAERKKPWIHLSMKRDTAPLPQPLALLSGRNRLPPPAPCRGLFQSIVAQEAGRFYVQQDRSNRVASIIKNGIANVTETLRSGSVSATSFLVQLREMIKKPFQWYKSLQIGIFVMKMISLVLLFVSVYYLRIYKGAIELATSKAHALAFAAWIVFALSVLVPMLPPYAFALDWPPITACPIPAQDLLNLFGASIVGLECDPDTGIASPMYASLYGVLQGVVTRFIGIGFGAISLLQALPLILFLLPLWVRVAKLVIVVCMRWGGSAS